MGRVFFPTYSLNRFGVRVASQRATLGGLEGVQRFPAEPTPRSAMTPTGPMLGSIAISDMLPAGVDGQRRICPAWGCGAPPAVPVSVRAPAPPLPIRIPPTPMPPVSSSGGGGAVVSAPLAAPSVTPPVSAQVGPTPTVTLPAPTSTGLTLISSGGGVATPSTPAVIAPAPSGGFVDSVATWLGGSTSLFNYNVPNALLAGAVVLGFAWLSAGKKR